MVAALSPQAAGERGRGQEKQTTPSILIGGVIGGEWDTGGTSEERDETSRGLRLLSAGPVK